MNTNGGEAGRWEFVTLAEIASTKPNAIVGGPFGSDLVSSDYVLYGVPVIRGQNMGERLVSGEFAFVSFDKAKSLKANTAAPGDIIFTQRGTLGQVSLVPEGEFETYLISQSQMKLTPDLRRCNPDFIWQYFKSPMGQRQIIESAIQTGVPHTNLGILRNYKIPLPPLRQQRAIAEILNDADGLIDSLQRVILKKTQMRDAAISAFLNGEKRLPGFSKPWTLKKIGELLTIRHGKSQKAVEDVKGEYPILATGGKIGNASRFLYDKPSVLIGRKGTIDRPQYIDTPFWSVDTLFYSEVTSPNDPKFLFYLFSTINWRNLNEASGVPSLSARTIEAVSRLVPEPDEQVAISRTVQIMDEELEVLQLRRVKLLQVKQGLVQGLLCGEVCL